MPFFSSLRTAVLDCVATIVPQSRTNAIRVFMDVDDGKLKAIKSDDTIIDLESGGSAIPSGWRLIEDGDVLKLQKNISSVWTTVHEFSVG